MKRVGIVAFVLSAVAIGGVARSGHELPIYPSFYPHEIEIRTATTDQAADQLRQGKIQAYVGGELRFPGVRSADIGMIESLGSFILVRINPESAHATDDVSACRVTKGVLRALAGEHDFIVHPYPVTPFHGDYLYHADLADAAKARLAGGDAPPLGDLKIRATGDLAQRHPDWSRRASDWNAEVIEIDAASVVESALLAVNGWLAPPWVRTGWFHAERLLAGAVSDDAQKQRVESDLQRLKSYDFNGLVERINLERDLVMALAGSCRTIVAGYTIKREYVNVEFSAGIENIGFDAIDGLNSPMFIRTVKLKDFPWNGWLALGIGRRPAAAWNPIGGMTDPFGRLMGSAVSDPALLPSPYETGWMLNRISDLPANWGR